jgi:DNA-binding IclR family transcriptional regulator
MLQMTKNKVEAAEEDGRRYRAPALEKGLDILELLARERDPLTVSAISQKLGRSMSELFRMIQVLEFRGFIQQAPSGDGFVPTDRLFSLGMEQAPTKSLLEIALPQMKQLSTIIGQSCHLAFRSRGDIVVAARVESAEQIGFSVRIGYRKSLALTRSGVVLFAFQEDAVRQRWIAELSSDITAEQIDEFQTRADKVREQGFDRDKSDFVVGVTDISAPVLRGHTAAAALTVPFVHSTQLLMPIDQAIRHLRAIAAEISASLLISDHRI